MHLFSGNNERHELIQRLMNVFHVIKIRQGAFHSMLARLTAQKVVAHQNIWMQQCQHYVTTLFCMW